MGKSSGCPHRRHRREEHGETASLARGRHDSTFRGTARQRRLSFEAPVRDTGSGARLRRPRRGLSGPAVSADFRCATLCSKQLRTMFDKFKEECGVFGVLNHRDAANIVYLGLYALQHRGQESAGIASVEPGTNAIRVEKEMGY